MNRRCSWCRYAWTDSVKPVYLRLRNCSSHLRYYLACSESLLELYGCGLNAAQAALPDSCWMVLYYRKSQFHYNPSITITMPGYAIRESKSRSTIFNASPAQSEVARCELSQPLVRSAIVREALRKRANKRLSHAPP